MIASVIVTLTRLISGATVRYVDFHPDPRQRIYFGNHSSHLDFVVIWSALPKSVRRLTRPVAARDYWGRGTLRRYLAERALKAVLIERGSRAVVETREETVEAARRTIDRLVAALGDQYSLVVFPEGTRGTGAEIGPFKSGLYHLCTSRPDVDLVPVYLDNLNRILPKGEVLPVPLLSSITFGPPMRIREGEPKAEFLERAREALLSLRRT